MIVGELLVICLLIFFAIVSFSGAYWFGFEPGRYKLFDISEKIFFFMVFFILGILCLIVAIDLYIYFLKGIHIIKEFLAMEV